MTTIEDAPVKATERWLLLNAEVMPKDLGPIAPKTITEDIRARVEQIGREVNIKVKEREDVIHSALVGRIAQLHLIMVGPGGTGKSYLCRVLRRHIDGSRPFEVTLDETSDPDVFLGPPDVKGLAEEGVTRRIPDGMLPCSTDAMIDEVMNANTPTKHALMKALNERLFDSAGVAYKIPLRMAIAGTNKLTTDVDEAPFFDRWHIRHLVEWIRDRDNQLAMVTENVLRNAELGRGGDVTTSGETFTTVTLEELDRANKESLSLNVPDVVAHAFFDLRDEIMYGSAGVQISDRRAADSMLAVMANAWLRGHTDVQIADLDILAHMWWNRFEERTAVRSAVLAVTNPGERTAYDLIEEFEEIQLEVKNALADPDLDVSKKQAVTIQAMTKVKKIGERAAAAFDESVDAGRSTTKLQEVLKRVDAYKKNIASDVFGI